MYVLICRRCYAIAMDRMMMSQGMSSMGMGQQMGMNVMPMGMNNMMASMNRMNGGMNVAVRPPFFNAPPMMNMGGRGMGMSMMPPHGMGVGGMMAGGRGDHWGIAGGGRGRGGGGGHYREQGIRR